MLTVQTIISINNGYDSCIYLIFQGSFLRSSSLQK